MFAPYVNQNPITTYTAADYNPSTAAGTGAIWPGPLGGLAANIASVRLTGLSVNIIPLANSNINGSVYYCYSESAASLIPIS